MDSRKMTTKHASTMTERSRVVKEYERRDRLGLSSQYNWQNSAHVFHMQEREWSLLRLAKLTGVDFRGGSVVEVGCGGGHVLQRLAELGAARAVGIDLSDNRLRAARERYPLLELCKASADALPFADSSVDIVAQFMCFSSILSEETRRAAASEMLRVVRPGGSCIFYDLRPRPLGLRALNWLLGAPSRIRRGASAAVNAGEPDAPTPIHLIGERELRTLFAGGTVVAVRSVSLDFNWAYVAEQTYLGATLLSMLPFLRTHLLAVVRKDA
jgi:ubiquinone/menaquinone biosynthesis C-methylase UbiE